MPQNYCVVIFNILTNRREAIARQRGDRATQGESLRIIGDILQDKVPRRNWKIRQTAAEASRVEIDSVEVHRTFVSARCWRPTDKPVPHYKVVVMLNKI